MKLNIKKLKVMSLPQCSSAKRWGSWITELIAKQSEFNPSSPSQMHTNSGIH